jgi:hypothetical protein
MFKNMEKVFVRDLDMLNSIPQHKRNENYMYIVTNEGNKYPQQEYHWNQKTRIFDEIGENFRINTTFDGDGTPIITGNDNNEVILKFNHNTNGYLLDIITPQNDSVFHTPTIDVDIETNFIQLHDQKTDMNIVKFNNNIDNNITTIDFQNSSGIHKVLNIPTQQYGVVRQIPSLINGLNIYGVITGHKLEIFLKNTTASSITVPPNSNLVSQANLLSVFPGLNTNTTIINWGFCVTFGPPNDNIASVTLRIDPTSTTQTLFVPPLDVGWNLVIQGNAQGNCTSFVFSDNINYV